MSAPGRSLKNPARTLQNNFKDAAANGQGSDRAATAESLTDLKPLGQVNASFIVAVNGEGLWIIDQHVAHERILFEQHLKARREGQMTGQRMLMPHIVELISAPGSDFRSDFRRACRERIRGFANGPAKCGDSGDAGRNFRGRRRKITGRNSGWSRARESSHLDGLAAIAHRCNDVVPCGDQNKYAAGPDKNGMAVGRAGENGSADELSARTPSCAALFRARN